MYRWVGTLAPNINHGSLRRMSQASLHLPLGVLQLPDILLGPFRYSCGEAFKLLREGEESEVVDQHSVKISPRLSETVLVLQDGERIIVTDRKSFPRPDNVDGILVRENDGSLVWRSHQLIDDAMERIEQDGLATLADEATVTWKGALQYKAEALTVETEADWGLRPPQLGALFAVGSHWTQHVSPATIVMPTGTGKTETMLAVQVAHEIRRMLVAVPSRALRAQIRDKFVHFGLLRKLHVISADAEPPLVGVLTRRPKSVEDLAIFRDCNVVIGTVASLADGTAADLVSDYAEIVDALIVDEAHHVAASSWSRMKEGFSGTKTLQFTATPFRNDGKLVGGSVIYSYSLQAAQQDGYFRNIEFIPVHEVDERNADESIARKAIDRLRSDIEADRDHLMIVRCRSKERAEQVFEIYQRLAPDLSPLLIHSEIVEADKRVAALRAHQSRIAVCVNMLGEGVDIPSLKVAAVHDKHQSLAVLLQFVGRITRKGGANLGDASVVANIADVNISLALENLYAEDADWNVLLREMSSNAAKEHAEFIHFLEGSHAFEAGDTEAPSVSHQSLRPIFSTLIFRANAFHPKRFVEGLPDRWEVVRVWINEESRTLYFVARSSERVRWTNAKDIHQIEWALFVLHFDSSRQLLYVASTNKGSNFDTLAKAVGATEQINGEVMFRSLGNIGRLVFNNLGVTKHGRRNLSFAMYTGADVKQALSETEKKGSRKSNISGYGWENGKQITIGCSYKGRVWSKAGGTIPQFIQWAERVGAKVIDTTIDTKSVIANVLIPEYANDIPDCAILTIDWPYELLVNAEDQISVSAGGQTYDWLAIDLEWRSVDRDHRRIEFSILTGEPPQTLAVLSLVVEGEAGFEIKECTDVGPMLKIGSGESPIVDFFNNYPPLIRFVDLSELDGNILLRSEDAGTVPLPPDRIVSWDWNDIDITKESIWKDGLERRDSVQWAAAQQFIEAGFDVVFDDDGRNEAADLICVKETDDDIVLALVHCKFSEKSAAGGRVKDVVEVASQAIRSARWPGKFKELVRHINRRVRTRSIEEGRSLFLAGSAASLSTILRASRFKEVRPQIWIIQPGMSASGLTENQSIVLGAAAAYLKETLSVDLDIVGAA